MDPFAEGYRVRVDIPDETNPDYDQYHGEYGTIIEILEDDAGRPTGEEKDVTIFRIEFPFGKIADLRWRDLRPPIE
jgi:hypothetical protein